MPIDPDFAREERIKRLRAIAKRGTELMLILHDAIPAYLRQADWRLQPSILGLEFGEKLFEGISDDVHREHAIRLGYIVAERNHRVYTKVQKWLTDADNTSPRNLSDEVFAKYKRLPPSFHAWIDTDKPDSLESQILHLSEVV